MAYIPLSNSDNTQIANGGTCAYIGSNGQLHVPAVTWATGIFGETSGLNINAYNGDLSLSAGSSLTAVGSDIWLSAGIGVCDGGGNIHILPGCNNCNGNKGGIYLAPNGGNVGIGYTSNEAGLVTNTLTVDGTGSFNDNVGIGTHSPIGRLQVVGGTGTQLLIDHNGGGNNYIDTAGILTFRIGTSYTQMMMLNGTGLGIGKTAGEKLDVCGFINATGGYKLNSSALCAEHLSNWDACNKRFCLPNQSHLMASGMHFGFYGSGAGVASTAGAGGIDIIGNAVTDDTLTVKTYRSLCSGVKIQKWQNINSTVASLDRDGNFAVNGSVTSLNGFSCCGISVTYAGHNHCIANIDDFPALTCQLGKFLSVCNNGTIDVLTWSFPTGCTSDLLTDFPAYGSCIGCVLSVDGSGLLAWTSPAGGFSLPSDSGCSGCFLTTDGSGNCSWGCVPAGFCLPNDSGCSGCVLGTDGMGNCSWVQAIVNNYDCSCNTYDCSNNYMDGNATCIYGYPIYGISDGQFLYYSSGCWYAQNVPQASTCSATFMDCNGTTWCICNGVIICSV